MIEDNKKDSSPPQKDFIGYRLTPFFIGTVAFIAISVVNYIVTLVTGIFFIEGSITFIAAIVAALSGVNVDEALNSTAIKGALVSIPIWLIIYALNIGLLILLTWLFGQWIQKKYNNHKLRRHNKMKFYKSTNISSSNNDYKEDEWVREWNRIKRLEEEKFSSENTEDSNCESNKIYQPEENNTNILNKQKGFTIASLILTLINLIIGLSLLFAVHDLKQHLVKIDNADSNIQIRIIRDRN